MISILQILFAVPVFYVALAGLAAVTLASGASTVLRPRKRPPSLSHVLVTGASSGLGEGFALHYAAPGVTLSLTGRDAARLDAVASRCKARGATVRTCVADVTDAMRMDAFVTSAYDAEPIDLVIANAGVSEETTGTCDDVVAATRAIFPVNVDGVFNTVLPLIPRMKARGRGQLALMSSISGECGMPGGAAAYCASKVAVRAYGEGLRGLLYRDGVLVSVICPGWVRTPMTDLEERSLCKWELEPAIRFIAAALARDEPVIQFPTLLSVATWMIGTFLPARVRHGLGRHGLMPDEAFNYVK